MTSWLQDIYASLVQLSQKWHSIPVSNCEGIEHFALWLSHSCIQARNLGPWSSAYELVNARAAGEHICHPFLC